MKYRLIIKATGWTLDGVRAHVKDKLQLPNDTKMSVTRRAGTDSPTVVVDLDIHQIRRMYYWNNEGDKAPFPVGTLLFFNEVIDNPTTDKEADHGS